MVMLAFAMMEVIRHQCQSAAAKKKGTPNHAKTKTIGASSLIRWSIQEVRRIAISSLRSGSNRPHHRMVLCAELTRRSLGARTSINKTAL